MNSNAPDINGLYNYDFLYVLAPFANLPVDSAPTSPPFGTSEKILNYISLNATFLNNVGNGNVFTFDNGINIDNYYVGCFIITSLGLYQIFITYTGSTRSGTISTNFNNESSCSIRTVICSSAFSPQPLTNTITYILPTTADNFNGLNFSGSSNAIQQEVCYEVELKNLVLPNTTLSVGHGGLIAFYPYLYVELTLLSAKSNKIINSNNPNSTKMTFRVVVSDTQNPAITPWVRLRSDGTTQKIKFKPNDNFHFSVRLPNGELFNTTMPEQYSPSPPNPLIQISALFSLKRLISKD